jgi:hypothetical protein
VPEQRTRLLARRNAVLSAALKADANDAWAVRTLARQAISDPGSVPNRKALLPSVAAQAKQNDDALNHRLHGGVLLRTGSAREAIGVLEQAIRKRRSAAPPLEELLLALAHLRLDKPAEARGYLKDAIAWMKRGSEPIRAASLSGLAAHSPLTTLASLAVTPPDPRLVPLDPQTAHELTALRTEVEKALANHKP